MKLKKEKGKKKYDKCTCSGLLNRLLISDDENTIWWQVLTANWSSPAGPGKTYNPHADYEDVNMSASISVSIYK